MALQLICSSTSPSTKTLNEKFITNWRRQNYLPDIPNYDRVIKRPTEQELWSLSPVERPNGSSMSFQNSYQANAGRGYFQHYYLPSIVTNKDMLRQRIKLHGCAPRFKSVAPNLFPSLSAVCWKGLISGTRQNPSRLLGKLKFGDSHLVCQIFSDGGEAVAVFWQMELRYSSIFLSNK